MPTLAQQIIETEKALAELKARRAFVVIGEKPCKIVDRQVIRAEDKVVYDPLTRSKWRPPSIPVVIVEEI